MPAPQYSVRKTSHGLTDVPGFEAAGVHSDVRGKKDGRLDTALIYSAQACSAAGVFTRHAAAAAPVKACQEVFARRSSYHGLIVNSGNANAGTGERGLKDARTLQALVARPFGVPPLAFFVCSTGRIGEPLPMPALKAGIAEAVNKRASTQQAGRNAAEAILTSDTGTKLVTVEVPHRDKVITLAGMAKGAGMIEPNMATMLAFFATDAAVPNRFLGVALRHAVADTFNAITVDGDRSTNDTVLVLANGASGVRVGGRTDHRLNDSFKAALRHACAALADAIVADGERISRVVEILIHGAKSGAQAERLARAVGNSLLVKTSWFGADPNWGRLLDAAGYAGVPFNPDRLDIHYAPYPEKDGPLPPPWKGREAEPVPVLLKGRPQVRHKPRWKQVVSARRFTLCMNFNQGKGAYRLLSTDLSTGYVDFNKSE